MGLAARKYTESEYAETETRASYRSEYFNGEIFAMAGGTLVHSRLCVAMCSCLRDRVDPERCIVADSNLRIRIPATSLQTYPDASVICGKPVFVENRNDCIENPVVIVEVLSEGTEAYDRNQKFTDYKKLASLREYVLVSQHRPRIEVYRRGRTGRWTLAASEGLDAVIALTSIGVAIPLADVYRGIELPRA